MVDSQEAMRIEIGQLKSRVQGLKVNRDALLEENRRFRASFQTKGVKIVKLEQQIKELKSELEGKMEGAHEVITQLETQIAQAKGLRIEIVQLSGKNYFWVLVNEEKMLCSSCQITIKMVIKKEAEMIAAQLGLPVTVNERRK